MLSGKFDEQKEIIKEKRKQKGREGRRHGKLDHSVSATFH